MDRKRRYVSLRVRTRPPSRISVDISPGQILKQVSLSILLTYRRFLSTTSRFSRRRPRDGARLSGARLHPCRENRRPGQMAGRPLATFQFKDVAACPIVHNPRKVTISLRFRAADATAARLLLRNWGTEKAVAGLASRKTNSDVFRKAKHSPIGSLLSMSEGGRIIRPLSHLMGIPHRDAAWRGGSTRAPSDFGNYRAPSGLYSSDSRAWSNEMGV